MMVNRRAEQVKVFLLFLVLLLLFSVSVFAKTDTLINFNTGIKANSNDGQVFFSDLLLSSGVRKNEDYYLLFNPRFSSNFSGVNETNLGLICRYPINNWVLGGNIYYDIRNTERDNIFNQLGIGVEALSQNFNLNFNYYLPQTDQQLYGQGAIYAEESIAEENYYEEAMQGYDIGVSVPLPMKLPLKLSAEAVYHSFKSNDESTSGIDLNLTGKINNISIKAGRKTDDIFEDETYLQMNYSVAFGQGAESAGNKTETDKNVTDKYNILTTPVRRDLNIITRDKAEKTAEYETIYVDNSNSADGSGTLSNPYNSLEQVGDDLRYQNADAPWIYVFSGDGTATGLTGSYTLKENAEILGEGYNYKGLGGNSYPLLAGLSGEGNPVLNLTGNNTVRGLKFAAGENTAINLDYSGVNDLKVTIIGNQFVSGDYAINLVNSGTAGIDATIRDNIIGPASGSSFDSGGINFDSGTADGNLIISGNTLQRLNDPGIDMDNSSGANTNLNIEINNNTFNLIDGYGIELYTYNPGNITINNNAFSNLDSDVLDATINSSNITFTASANKLANIDGYGFEVSSDYSDNQYTFKDNILTSIYDNSFELDFDNADNSVLTISDNVLRHGNNGAINFYNLAGEDITLSITGNNINNMLSDGINISDTDPLFNSIITVKNNVIANCGIYDEEVYGNGLYLRTYGNNNTFNIKNNSISSTYYEGLYSKLEGTNNEVTIVNNDISGTNYNGIYLAGDGDNTYTISRNSIADTFVNDEEDIEPNGIMAEFFGNGATVTIGYNTVSGTRADGINVYDRGSNHTVNIMDNDLSDVISGYGIYVYSEGTGTHYNIEENNVTGINDGDGLHVGNDSTGASFDIKNNTITNVTTGNGISINTGRPTAETEFDITGNTVSNVGNNGLYLWISSGDLGVTIENNTISNAGYDGIHLLSPPGYSDTAEFVLSDNTIINNLDDGIEVYIPSTSSVVDLGGGSPGSTGGNSIYGNTGYQVYNDSGNTISALNNWWGQVPVDEFFYRRVLYIPYLDEAPAN